MYPKNAASPERIAIGPVVQISDGVVQTSGVAVKVMPFGAAESSGGGTIAYTADGVVIYTPTQAETNYTSFLLIASKSGCIPASVTVVTTASATAGYAGLDWSKVSSPTTTLALTGTTIATTQKVDVETIKTNPVVNGGTITFPTGATLASTTNITAGTIATVSGNVSGNVVGSVASIATGGISAASFAAGAIDAAAIATDAIGSNEISAAAVTKIQAGLSTYAGGDTSGVTSLLNRVGLPFNGSLAADYVALTSAVSTVNTIVTDTAAEVYQIIKSGEEVTHVRAGKSDVTETITRV